MHAKPRMTVAICTRNRARLLEKAVQSVIPQLTDEDELLIIDNASTDETAEVARRFAASDPRIRAYREPKPGLSAARNAAHRLGRADYVLFLDDDATVRSGWLNAYVNFIQRHQGGLLGCVGGEYIPEYETAPPAWHNQERDRIDLGAEELLIRGEAAPGGANCAYSTAAVLAVGGFCDDLKRAEDTDIHHLLQKAGYEIWWLPGAPIYHFLPRQRLTFWRLARAAFRDGRASGRVRLRQRQSVAARETYRLARILVSAPYVLYYVVLALLTVPVRGGRLAARSFQRAMRVAGMGWQMLADLAAVNFGYLNPKMSSAIDLPH